MADPQELSLDSLKSAGYPAMTMVSSDDGSQQAAIPTANVAKSGLKPVEGLVYMSHSGQTALIPQSKVHGLLSDPQGGWTIGPSSQAPEEQAPTPPPQPNPRATESTGQMLKRTVAQPFLQAGQDAMNGHMAKGVAEGVVATPRAFGNLVTEGGAKLHDALDAAREAYDRNPFNIAVPTVNPSFSPTGNSMETTPEQSRAIADVQTGAGHGLVDAATAAAQPGSIVTAGILGGAPAAAENLPRLAPFLRLAGKAAGTYFGVNSAKDAIQQGSQGVQDIANGNVQQGTRNLTGAAVNTGMAAKAIGDTVGNNPSEIKQNALQTAADTKALGQQITQAPGVRQAIETAKSAGAYWNPTANASPEELATMAFRPRNSKTNWQQEVASALPDARRAADSMGIDTQNMSMDDALKAVNQAKKDVWGEYAQRYLGPNADLTQDASPVADAIRSTITDRMAEQNPGLAKKIGSIADTYEGRDMKVSDLQDRVSQLNNELRSIEARYVTDKRAAKLSPQNAYKFAERDTLRGLLDQKLNEMGTEGDAADLRQRWGALNSLEDVISRRIPVADRQAPESLPKTLAKMYAASRLARGVITLNPADILEGGVSLLSQRRSALLNDPEFLTQQAFGKTTPTPPPPQWVDGEYMPHAMEGESSAVVPSGFPQPQLPPSTRAYGPMAAENPDFAQEVVNPQAQSQTNIPTRDGRGVLLRKFLLNPAKTEDLLPQTPTGLPGNTQNTKALPSLSESSRQLPPSSLPPVPAFRAVSHPDIPGGQVVGLDADTHLPIVKRGAPQEPQSETDRARQAIRDAGLIDRGEWPGTNMVQFEHPELGGEIAGKKLPTTLARSASDIQSPEDALRIVAEKAKSMGMDVPKDVQEKLSALRPEESSFLAQHLAKDVASNGEGHGPAEAKSPSGQIPPVSPGQPEANPGGPEAAREVQDDRAGQPSVRGQSNRLKHSPAKPENPVIKAAKKSRKAGI